MAFFALLSILYSLFLDLFKICAQEVIEVLASFARSLQENFARLAANQSARTIAAIRL